MPITHIPSAIDFYQWTKLHIALTYAIESSKASYDRDGLRREYENYQIRLETYFRAAQWEHLYDLQELAFPKMLLKHYAKLITAEQLQHTFAGLCETVCANLTIPVADKSPLLELLGEVRWVFERTAGFYLKSSADKSMSASAKAALPWLRNSSAAADTGLFNSLMH
jgi:hypothetical protein